jgi:hypothetical protein
MLGEAEQLEDAPGPRPNHHARADLLEDPSGFIDIHLNVCVTGERNSEAEATDAPAAVR